MPTPLRRFARREVSLSIGVAVLGLVVGALAVIYALSVKRDAKHVATSAAVAVAVERSFTADLVSWQNTIRGCGRSTRDRLDEYKVLSTSARANHIVGTDPGQPRRTRRARMVESEIQASAAASLLLRTSETTAGRFEFCMVAFPQPAAPPDCVPCVRLVQGVPSGPEAFRFP